MSASASGIATYDDLVQRCQDWLFGRVDIAVQVPTFIRLFEAKANRKLLCRQMETRCVSTINITVPEPEFLVLPSDFQTMRRIRLIKTLGSPPFKPRLSFATGAQLDDLRVKYPDPGAPIWFTVLGNEIELLPMPDNTYQVEMVYRVYLPALGAGVQTNWLMDLAPDAYLYGTLMEAAPYLHDDDRIAVWASGVAAAISDLNDLSEQATYNAGPLVMRRRGSGYS
jgi:hypothetical protein